MAARPHCQSPEYTAFRNCTDRLVAIFQDEIGAFSDALFSKEFIGSDVRAYTLTTGITDPDKARRMLDAVLIKISLEPKMFHEFVTLYLLPNHISSQLQAAYKLEQELQQQDLAKCDGNPSGKESFPSTSSEVANTEAESQFPYLDVKTLSKSERLALESKLISETQKMEHCFYKLSESVRESLDANNSVSLEHVLGLVLSVGTIEEKHKEEIKQATSIIRIVNILRASNYITFFHYYIIEKLVKEFGSDEDHKKLDAYLEELGKFCERSVHQVPKSVFDCKARSSAKILALKCEEHIMNLNRVREIINQFVGAFLDVEVSDFQLCTIKEGCVELHFLVPAKIVFQVPPSISVLAGIGVRIIDPYVSQERQIQHVAPSLSSPTVGHKDLAGKIESKYLLSSDRTETGSTQLQKQELGIKRKRSDSFDESASSKKTKLEPPQLAVPKSPIDVLTSTLKSTYKDSERPAKVAEQKVFDANQIIQNVQRIANELNFADSAKQLSRISHNLTSGKVQVGLVGLTNAGKSTSLNSLMGTDILPSSFQRQTVSSVCILHQPNSPGDLFGRTSSNAQLSLLASGSEKVRAFICNLNDHDRENPIFYSELVLKAPVLFLEGKEKVDLEIFDTPGTSEAGSTNVCSIWNTALNNLAAIVLIISADYVFEVSQATLLEKIRNLHPHMMEKQSRMLVVVNKYDKCFDGNQESWNPAQLRQKVAEHIKVPSRQVLLFSATSALKARKWKSNPGAVDEDDYGKEYFILRQTPEKAAIAGLKDHNLENVSKLAEALERFSKVQEVEERLLGQLCVNGPGILLESAVDDTLREVAKLKSETAAKIKAIDLGTKRGNVSQQESLIKRVDEQLEKHCKQKINVSLPSLSVSAFQVQLNAIASNLESQLVSGASGKVVSLRGEFDDRNNILQRVLGVRNELRQIGGTKVNEAWTAAVAGMKTQLTTQLTQLVQELKQDIHTSQLSDHLNFETVIPTALVGKLAFPSVQQPAFNTQVVDAAMNALVTSKVITRQRTEQRSRKAGGRRYGIAGPRETIHYTEVVNYQVTVYEVNIDALNSAFRQLAVFASGHIRTVIARILQEQASKLSEGLWAQLQQLSKQPLSRLKSELEERRRCLGVGEREAQALDKKVQELDKSETELRNFL